MLPDQITQLVDNFVTHYDAENPRLIKFRGIRNAVLGRWAARGWHGWQMGAVVEIGKELRLFVEKRGKFILEKLLQVINETDVGYYPALNDDCKNHLAAKINPNIQAAKGYLEEMRIEANAASSVMAEATQAFDNLLLGFNAEIDLFCAAYCAKSNQKDRVKGTADKMVFNINTVQGPVGNVSHSPTNLNSNISRAEVNETLNHTVSVEFSAPYHQEIPHKCSVCGFTYMIRNPIFIARGDGTHKPYVTCPQKMCRQIDFLE